MKLFRMLACCFMLAICASAVQPIPVTNPAQSGKPSTISTQSLITIASSPFPHPTCPASGCPVPPCTTFLCVAPVQKEVAGGPTGMPTPTLPTPVPKTPPVPAIAQGPTGFPAPCSPNGCPKPPSIA